MAIGERIRFIRNLRGMTQKWLGQAVGFPQKTADIRMAQYLSLIHILPMVGLNIDYLNPLQERNRGAELHSLICEYLGYSIYEDDGNYPDIANQLLEIK